MVGLSRLFRGSPDKDFYPLVLSSKSVFLIKVIMIAADDS